MIYVGSAILVVVANMDVYQSMEEVIGDRMRCVDGVGVWDGGSGIVW